MPKVSVIIPVYNVEPYLRRCLESVCKQTLQDIEIICINDCSCDNSLEILREYEAKDSRVKVISFCENKGVSTARNAGIDEAAGKFIGFVDPDDYIDLDFYEKLYNCAMQTGADIAKANLRIIRLDNRELMHANLSEVRKNKVLFQYVPTAIFKNALIKENDLRFPEDISWGEDAVFEVKVIILCNEVCLCEDTFYNYVRREKSLSNVEEYNEEHVISRTKSTKAIFDILNAAKLDKQTYLSAALLRYEALTDWVLPRAKDDKCRKMVEDALAKIHIKYGDDFEILRKQVLEERREAALKRKQEQERRRLERERIKREAALKRKQTILQSLRRNVGSDLKKETV